jgi:anti-sigma factor RsiW
VSCDRSETVLHGYFDNELDALSAADFERHLEQCYDCSVALESLKSLRSSLNDSQLYAKTPSAVREKMLAQMGAVKNSAKNSGGSAATTSAATNSATISFAKPDSTTSAKPSSRTGSGQTWQWLAIAAALLLALFGTWRVISITRAPDANATLTAEVVDAHLRSLQPGHLTDVLSTDQHTVKPWFDGKIDFAPPVRDFAEQGFPLQGGRLDIINHRTVAALVYGRRKHLINVFIWPDDPSAPFMAKHIAVDTDPVSGSRQGYQYMSWHRSGMQFYATSDVNSADLQQLYTLLTQ